MINQHQIMRLVETQQFRKLAERILANGRCESRSALRLLASPEAAAPVALGLALQRLGELTYGRCPESGRLAGLLVELQRPDGSFGGILSTLEAPAAETSEAVLAATAVTVRGLLAWRDQHECVHGLAEEDQSLAARVAGSSRRALEFLASRFNASRDINDEALGWAVALWQLGDRRQFRLAINVAVLSRMLDRSDIGEEVHDLRRYAGALAA